MIAKLKKRRSKDQEIIRKKLQMLSVLAYEFLEKTFSYDSLVGDLTEMKRIKSILWENLWQKKIKPDDPDWDPETNEDFAKMILYYHKVLTEGFWNNFKKELAYVITLKKPLIIPDGFEWVGSESMISIRDFSEIEIPNTSMTVRFFRNNDKVEFMRSGVDAIPALLDLLQGLPMDHLTFCGNTECGKFIVKVSGKERKFCHGLCQSIQYQRERRKKAPEEHRKYHREYYRTIKMKKNRAKTIAKGGV